MSVIKRNDTLQNVLKYWNHNDKSNIGSGRLSRTLDASNNYVHTQHHGREDIKLFNVKTITTVNGIQLGKTTHNQYAIDPSYPISFKDHLIEPLVRQWFNDNKDEIKIQIHYLKWFNAQTIQDMLLPDLLELLNDYYYNNEEAEHLFTELVSKSFN